MGNQQWGGGPFCCCRKYPLLPEQVFSSVPQVASPCFLMGAFIRYGSDTSLRTPQFPTQVGYTLQGPLLKPSFSWFRVTGKHLLSSPTEGGRNPIGLQQLGLEIFWTSFFTLKLLEVSISLKGHKSVFRQFLYQYSKEGLVSVNRGILGICFILCESYWK